MGGVIENEKYMGVGAQYLLIRWSFCFLFVPLFVFFSLSSMQLAINSHEIQFFLLMIKFTMCVYTK